jgi:amino acid adenylation domain-containing protein/FkbM family methyltransferase
VTEKDDLLRRLLEEEGLSASVRIPRRADPEDRPLSFAQQRLWFLDQMDPGNPIYNMPAALRLRGPLDATALQATLGAIVARHEALRSVFPAVEGRPTQRVLEASPFALPLRDQRSLAEAEREQALRARIQDELRRGFDLAQGPLLRASLLRLADQEHVLLLNMHHIVSDGWSMGLFVRELAQLYPALRAAWPAPLPQLPLQYADYACWQRERLRGPFLDELLAYWKQALAGAPTRLELAADRPRPAAQSFRGALHSVHVPRSVVEPLRALAREENGTLFMTLLAAFATLLQRHTGEERLLVATSIAGRTQPELEGLIGFFVNMLPLHADLTGDPSFRELLRRLRTVTLGAFDHQEMPFERLVEELQPERDLSFSPLCQVFFALQNAPMPALELPELRIETMDIGRATAKYDLYLETFETQDGLKATFEYATDLFAPATIEGMASQLQTLLAAIAQNPDERLSRLPLLSRDERERRLQASSSPAVPGTFERSLQEMFEARVEQALEAQAARCGEQALSYRELNERANRLAARLAAAGVGPERPVAVLLERSLETLVALLAIVKAGGAYLALDPASPAAHRDLILEDARPWVVVTRRGLEGLRGSTGVPVLFVEGAAMGPSLPNPPVRVGPDHLALVTYTSGTTGRPKGILVPHRQLLHRLAWMWSAFPFEPGEVACQRTTSTFSVSLWEFLGPLLAGVPNVILPDAIVKDAPRLVDSLAREGVTRIILVPSLLRMLLDADVDLTALRRLRLWSACGEVLTPELVERFRRRLPWARLLHQYGSSETNDSICHEVTASETGRVPIGLPNAGVEAYVLDQNLELLPACVPGDLYVGGNGLARGYLNRPDLTATVFVPHPFAAAPGARLYRTGDRARVRPDGRLEYLGRRDHQVKLRGVRVELGGVEALLREHPDVRHAAVTAQADAGGDMRLAAFVVPRAERARTLQGRERYVLRNGLAIVHLNRNETDFLYSELFEGLTYLKHGIALEDGACVFDVGANIGLFALFAHTRCRRPVVYAFEPNPEAYEALALNAQLYGVDARLFRCGLSDRGGAATFTAYPRFTFMSGLYADPTEEKGIVRSFVRKQQGGDAPAGMLEELLAERFETRQFPVELRRMSDVIREQGVERIDLLKVNVEKAELDVLLGIDDGDWKRIRQVVLQVHDVEGKLARVVALLEGHGFGLTVVDDWAVDASQHMHYVYATREPRGTRPAPPAETSEAPAPFLGAGELRDYLRERVPEQMVPASFSLVEALPLTANGKIDRRALAALARRPALETTSVAPRDGVEEALARIFCEVLNLPAVGVHDSFFDLGGHSLLATQVVSRVRRSFHLDLPLPALFEQPTVAGLARALARWREQEESQALEVLRAVESLSEDAVAAQGGEELP